MKTDEELLRIGLSGRLTWDERVRLQKLRAALPPPRTGPRKRRTKQTVTNPFEVCP